MKAIAIIAVLSILLTLLSGCRDGPPNMVHTLYDVDGRVIGAFSGTPSERMANELGSATTFASAEELIMNLRAGTVDCVVVESSVAAELVANNRGIRVLSEPLIKYDLRFAIARENTDLLNAVNLAIEALRQNGTLRSLSNRYFARGNFTYVSPEDIVRRPGYLSLAAPPDSPPFSMMDEYGEFSGLDIDVARAVCDFLGVELRIIEYDSWELVNAVWFGMADMAVGWIPGEGEEFVNTSEPYADTEHVIIVRR